MILDHPDLPRPVHAIPHAAPFDRAEEHGRDQAGRIDDLRQKNRRQGLGGRRSAQPVGRLAPARTMARTLDSIIPNKQGRRAT